jgi:hypothetical protein
MSIVQEQLEQVAANQLVAIQDEFNVEVFSVSFIQQLNELTPCYLKEIVHLNLTWYVNAWVNDLFAAYPDQDASDIELIDYILERQPTLRNSKGVIEHVIAVSHRREYPFPVDRDIVDSMSDTDTDAEERIQQGAKGRKGITNPGKKAKGRKKHNL